MLRSAPGESVKRLVTNGRAEPANTPIVEPTRAGAVSSAVSQVGAQGTLSSTLSSTLSAHPRSQRPHQTHTLPKVRGPLAQANPVSPVLRACDMLCGPLSSVPRSAVPMSKVQGLWSSRGASALKPAAIKPVDNHLAQYHIQLMKRPFRTEHFNHQPSSSGQTYCSANSRLPCERRGT